MHNCNQKDDSARGSQIFPNAISQKHLRNSLVISWADFRRENTINGFVKVLDMKYFSLIQSLYYLFIYLNIKEQQFNIICR